MEKSSSISPNVQPRTKTLRRGIRRGSRPHFLLFFLLLILLVSVECQTRCNAARAGPALTEERRGKETDSLRFRPRRRNKRRGRRYSSNFSRRNIHEQPRPSVLFRFYSPVQMGRPGSESLLYEAGNPCR